MYRKSQRKDMLCPEFLCEKPQDGETKERSIVMNKQTKKKHKKMKTRNRKGIAALCMAICMAGVSGTTSFAATVPVSAGQDRLQPAGTEVYAAQGMEAWEIASHQSGIAGFQDVIPGKYYSRPVEWAVQKQVTTGTSPITFSPDAYCTRAQTVAFLWRIAGQPEPTVTDTGFMDVPADSYYAKAVAWAVEQGITTGRYPGMFDPEGICTRGEFVTFLFRSLKLENYQGGANRFLDVEEWKFYRNPIAWAVQNGVTTGTSADTFSPNDPCTRGQVVTFLHRWDTTLSIWDCGAVPGDGMDDTDAINRAIERAFYEEDAEAVYIPAGTYDIDAAKEIRLKSNTTLQMDPSALLEVGGNALDGYCVLRLDHVDNVHISGGQIGGERYKHTGTSGEWGMGIGIYDSTNVSIKDMKISRNWGDGIYLGTTNYEDTLYGCSNISIERCQIYDNRRSNISIVDADHVTINGCTITDANGKAPQCGINIEPNRNAAGVIPDDAICRGIQILNTTINVRAKGDYWGQFFCFMTINYPDNSICAAEDILISNCSFNGDCGNYSGRNVRIENTTIGGTFYDEQNTGLNNVSYEDIWRG